MVKTSLSSLLQHVIVDTLTTTTISSYLPSAPIDVEFLGLPKNTELNPYSTEWDLSAGVGGRVLSP
jgi:hypothetical protein